MTRQEAINLLRKNEFKTLFIELGKLANEKKKKKIERHLLLLEGQYGKIKEDRLKGVETSSQLEIRTNRLRENILSLIDDLLGQELTVKRQRKRVDALLAFMSPILLLLLLIWGLQEVPVWMSFKLVAEVTYISIETAARKNLAENGLDSIPCSITVDPVTVINYSGKNVSDLSHLLSTEKEVMIDEIIVDRPVKISFKRDYNDIIISSSGHFITGRLTDIASTDLYIEPAIDLPLKISENYQNLLEFQTDPNEAVIVLSMKDASRFMISDVSINSVLGFAELDPVLNVPVSTLKGGQLEYPGGKIELKEHQIVKAVQWKNCKMSIEGNAENLVVIIVGQAQDLSVGYLNETQALNRVSRIEGFLKISNANILWWAVNILLGIVTTAFLIYLNQRRKGAIDYN